jgi:hypothetical protein
LRICTPRLRQTGENLALAIDSYQRLRELAKEKPLAVVRGIQGVRELDWLAQHHGKRLRTHYWLHRQATFVSGFDGSRKCRIWAAADQRDEENAGGRSRP